LKQQIDNIYGLHLGLKSAIILANYSSFSTEKSKNCGIPLI